MTINISFKVNEDKSFALVKSSTPTVAGIAKAMEKIFEFKKIFDQKTNRGTNPSWDEFSAKITAGNDATNFHLQLTSKDNEFIYNLKTITPKTAETLVSPEELKKLRSPPAPLPSPQSAPISAVTDSKPPIQLVPPAAAPTQTAAADKTAKTTNPKPAIQVVSPVAPQIQTAAADKTAKTTTGGIWSLLFGKPPSVSGDKNSSKTTDFLDKTIAPVQRPGLRGIGNTGNTCFMNATIQMIFNDPHLTQALAKTYAYYITHYEGAAKKWNIAIEDYTKQIAKMNAEPTMLSSSPKHAEYQNRLAEAKTEYEKCTKRVDAYKAFIAAEEIYRTNGDQTIDLEPLRYLLASADSQGSKKGQQGDAEEFFNVLFAEVNLKNYPIGFQDRFVRTYDCEYNAPPILPTEEISKIPVPTLQVELMNGKNGQQLINAIFELKKNDNLNVFIKVGKFDYSLNTEQRFLQGTPERLMIQLKRFVKNEKLTQDVEMPEQLMIQGIAYNLKTIVQHASGHYVNYVRKSDGWYYISDSSVTKAADITPGRKQGYLYFYEKA
jgi:hypothetical protein